MTSPLDLSDPTTVLLEALRAARGARVEAATYGGLALAAYGEPRETKDADLAVRSASALVMAGALREAGFDASVAFDRVRYGGNIISRISLLPEGRQTGLNTVDLVEPCSVRFARVVLDRAIETTLRGERVRIVTPEDFVLLKVLSTRARDIEDARSVVASIGPSLDRSLVESEARALAVEVPDHDVSSRLSEVLTP